MPTVLVHPVVALALAPAFRRHGLGPRLWALGAACTVAPDLDTIGYFLGVPYGSLLGHRGLSHSLAFALLLAIALVPLSRRLSPATPGPIAALYLFLCTASHGLLDALTNGGLGVALLSPFIQERLFFPFRPIQVSPLGISRFLSGEAWPVLLSELTWVVLPSVVLGGVLWYAGGKHRQEP